MRISHALGQPEEQTVTYSYYSDNLLKSVTDSLGRVTSFDYDSQGNTDRVTRLDGTSNAVTSMMSYTGQLGQLSTAVSPLGHAISYTYDNAGNLIASSDPVGRQTRATYDSAGEFSLVTDSAQQMSQFSYFGGDLTTKINPLGNVTNEFHDALGRITSTSDPLGQSTYLQYDVLNRVQQFTDPKGNISYYSYDANGNPVSFTDANGHTTVYSYDNMDLSEDQVRHLCDRFGKNYPELAEYAEKLSREHPMKCQNVFEKLYQDSLWQVTDG